MTRLHILTAMGGVMAMCGTLSMGCVDDDPGTIHADSVDTSAGDRDWFEVTCQEPTYVPGACEAGEIDEIPMRGAAHVAPSEPISYQDSPPSSGDHRPAWARWGDYDYLPPQRWLHNLEHGGVAFLYHPCAPQETIASLRLIAESQPDDDGGAFRWVMTPYPDLPTTLAVVAWEWRYQAECVDETAIEGFITEHYRQAHEDIPSDGPYETSWRGR